MKKLLIFAIFIIFFTGCVTHKINLKTSDIIEIEWNQNKLQKEDFEDLKSSLKKIDFHEVKEEIVTQNQLILHTNNEIYQFQINDEFVIQYKKNRKIYISKETNTVKKLVALLQNKVKQYQNISDVHIEFLNTLDNKETDFIVRLDKVDEYLKINSKSGLRNFKIHQLDYIEKHYQEINLLYEKKLISPEETIYIRTFLPEKIGTIKITFENQYGYSYYIIPTLKNGKLKAKIHRNTK